MRSDVTQFKQWVDDEAMQRLPDSLVRLQAGVQEAIVAVRVLADALNAECDMLELQLAEVGAADDYNRMREVLVRVRRTFVDGRSERSRGMVMLGDLQTEVQTYARQRAELLVRHAHAVAERTVLLRDAIEFGARVDAIEFAPPATPPAEMSMGLLVEAQNQLRGGNQWLVALLQQHVNELLRARRESCVALQEQMEAAREQGVAAAASIVRRLQRSIEMLGPGQRHEDARTHLHDAAAAGADAQRLLDELGVEQAALRMVREPGWDAIWALLGSLWMRHENSYACVVLASALRAGYGPTDDFSAQHLTQHYLRDVLTFVNGEPLVVAAQLLLDPYWLSLAQKLPPADNAIHALLTTAYIAAGDRRFSAGELWQPLAAAEVLMREKLPRWYALSERMLYDEAWQLTEEAGDHVLRVTEAEKVLRDEFSRKPDGRYARVSADGISNMLQIEQQKLLPDLERRTEMLFVSVPGSDAWSHSVHELDTTAEVIFDRYFGALNESRHPHMRRNLLHRLTGLHEKWREYIDARTALHSYEERRPLLMSELRAELDAAADLLGLDALPLAHALLAQALLMQAGLRRDWPLEQQASGGVDADYFAARIKSMLLTRSDVVRRMPRTAEYVFVMSDEGKLKWDQMLAFIAQDLGEPLTHIEMLRRFSESGFYFGAECVAAEHDPAALLELQKERAVLEAQVDALLARIHEPGDLLLEWRRTGRLRVLLARLQQEIAAQEEIERAVDEEKRRTLNVRLVKLKADVRDLEDEIQERDGRSELSHQVVEELMRGLADARNVALRRIERGVETAAQIVEEVFHFISFDGTSLAAVSGAIERHRDEMAITENNAGASRISSSLRVVIEPTAWLEDLRNAGLSESQFAVRRDVWDMWQRMIRMQSRLDDGGVVGEEAEILQNFVRKFSETTRLMYGRTGNETLFSVRPMAWFETRFQQPRDALRRYRVRFIFVTGAVAKRELRILEDHVRSQSLLEDGWLNVFVTPRDDAAAALRTWIFQNHVLETCSVLDGRTLQDILECRQNPTAAGRMCRLLLQSVDPVHIEVFRFQNVVDSDTDIFKGRAHEIKQIETGRGSFFIYGGRRIGKTSLLFAAEKQLRKAGAITAYASFEGHTDPQGLTVCRDVLRKLGVPHECDSLDAFRILFSEYVQRVAAEKPDKLERREVVIFLDEVDRHITSCRAAGQRSHPFIHVLRSLHQELHGKARFIMAGAIELWRQLNGRSEIPGAETPWANFGASIALGALNAADARAVVTTGFGEVLGIGLAEGVDRQIVENTTGHPAFVQFYCDKLHKRLHHRDGSHVAMEDVVAVFKDRRADSFVTYARDTLSLNLGDLTRLSVYLLAIERCDRFNTDDLARLAPEYSVPADMPWSQCLDELQMTGVIRSEGGMYRFSVPTYPELLRQMEASLQDDVNQLIQKIEMAYHAPNGGVNEQPK
ncbi:MAG: hypothetical protein NTZ50_02655 [Chloroflexi bacterium]|nr:hypothetical protein [Chloroflexota bacterium]